MKIGYIKMKPQWALLIRGFSEFCATSLFMMLSCMGYTIEGEVENRHVITSLVTGLAVVTTLHIFGFMSGAHTNPCVSIACYLLGHIRFSMMILYVSSQFVGCAFGYFLLLLMLPRSMIDGVVEPMKNISGIQIVAIEAFLTTTLIFAWCALWDVRSGRSLDSVALRMGCQVAVCMLVGVSSFPLSLVYPL